MDIALFDSLLATMTLPAAILFATGQPPRRMGNRTRRSRLTRRSTYSDGIVMVAAGNPRLWTQFCAAIGRPDLVHDPRFATNVDRLRERAALVEAIEAATSRMNVDEAIERFEAHGVPCGRVRTIDEALDDPQVAAREMLVSIDHAALGQIPLFGNPMKLSATACAYRRPPPALGEHTDEVLRIARLWERATSRGSRRRIRRLSALHELTAVHASQTLGLAAALAAPVWPAAPRPPQTPPTSLTLLTGGTGGSFYPLGAALAEIYSQRIPGIRAVAQSTVASVFNVQAVQQGKADVAFTQGDVAYFAYRRGTEADSRPHTKLRGIAVLWVNTVQLVVPRTATSTRSAIYAATASASARPQAARRSSRGWSSRRTASSDAQVRSEPLSFARPWGACRTGRSTPPLSSPAIPCRRSAR